MKKFLLMLAVTGVMGTTTVYACGEGSKKAKASKESNTEQVASTEEVTVVKKNCGTKTAAAEKKSCSGHSKMADAETKPVRAVAATEENVTAEPTND